MTAVIDNILITAFIVLISSGAIIRIFYEGKSNWFYLTLALLCALAGLTIPATLICYVWI
jgi:uncharacterized membrane protein